MFATLSTLYWPHLAEKRVLAVRITSIELENIKSYRHATIALRPGTVAIRGMNGAGKSTLVEAIGFALFDALSYDQAKFVREGERSGTVTVSFISAFDGREYQAVRRCGTGATWYIYDPDLSARAAEQKTDVTDFLRRHLRLESEIGLRDLFTDALGVPQGTFTADFLLTPAQRKKKFDTLLQVEEYRRASDKLLETKQYLAEQRHTQDLRIQALERETAELDAWETELGARIAEQSALTTQLATVEQESTVLHARRQELQRLSDLVTHLESAARSAVVIAETREHTAQEAATRLAEARAAAAACKESATDHAAYVGAEKALGEARARERERKAILNEQVALQGVYERAKVEVEQAKARLQEALDAARTVTALRDAVARQCELEGIATLARQDVARLEDARRERAKMEEQHQRALGDIAKLEHQLAALDPYRAAAAECEVLQEGLRTLLAKQATNVEQRQRLRVIYDQYVAAGKQRENLSTALETQRRQVQESSAAQFQAEQAPALETERAELERAISQAEITIKQHRVSMQQSGTGQCPFLAEPCLNIQRRGENNLVTFFERRISDEERNLPTLRARLVENTRKMKQVAAAKTHFDQLGPLQAGLERMETDLRALNEQIDRLRNEYNALKNSLDAAPVQEDIESLRAKVRRAEQATQALARESALRSHLETTQERAAQIADELATNATHIATLSAAAARLAETENELQTLDNPRQRSATAEATARDRENRANALDQRRNQAQAMVARLEEVAARLAPFVGLDQEIAEQETILQATRDTHLRFVSFEQNAKRLPERLDAAEKAEGAVAEAREAAEHARTAYQEAATQFDAEELARVSARADALRAEQGRLTQHIAHTQEATARLRQQIERAKGLLDDLREAREELRTLGEIEQMLAQFRDTIKEAGPNIMRALLKQISTEANRIFGEILGDRSAQLAWEADYEIVLRRDGRERTFALLSGGEQMSAALAVRLALLRSLTRLDIAFFDEPTTNMDGERRGNLAEQIRRVRGFEQLIVISHDDTFEQGLDSVVYLEKRHGETVLVEDALVRA